MDNFEKVNLDGNENIVGKNIIYKSHIVINLYNNKVRGKMDSFKFLFFLLVGFTGTLFSTGFYLNHIEKSHTHLLMIIGFCIILSVVSVIILIKSEDDKRKNNFKVLTGVAVVIGIIVSIVFMHSQLFFFEKSLAGLKPILSLLIISFVNFLLGIILFRTSS